MRTPARPRTQAFAAFVIGAIVLVLVTAILSSAVSASNADARTERLAAKLEHVTNDLTALRDDTAANKESADRARASLARDNDLLRRQNLVLAGRLLRLIRLAHENGISIPRSITTSGPSTTRPKGHRPHPANPGHTGTGPSGRPTPTPMYCQLVPALCDGLPLGLPTLLP